MKNSKEIISHLRSQPSFKKVKTQECIQKVVLILPPGIIQRVRFSYVKNHTLFFVLNHPGAKFEFDNIIKSIKKLLIEFINSCDTTLLVNDVKAFATHKPETISIEPLHLETAEFQERSRASFKNPFHTSTMYQKLEEIRAIIHEYRTA